MANAWTRREFVGGLAAVSAIRGGDAMADEPRNAEAAVQALVAGNERYTSGRLTSFSEDLKILKEKTVDKQEPFAAVLSCADSRVPVEILFDQTIGHLFVTRVAGNLVTPEITASLEYGVAVLGVKAILVLGHTNCGAVAAAVAGKEVPGQISALYQYLMPGIRGANGDVVQAVTTNVRFQKQLLMDSSTVIAKAVKAGEVKVVGGVYDLGSGKVTMI